MRSPVTFTLIPAPALRRAAQWLALTGLLAAGVRVNAQTVCASPPCNPAVDLYSTIKAQQVKPNLIFVTDRSGSMAQEMNSASTAGSETGVTFTCSTTGTSAQVCPLPASKYRWVVNRGPSRMAILKNVLGNSVVIQEFDPVADATQGCSNSSSCTTSTKPIKTINPSHLIDDNAAKINLGLLRFDGSGGVVTTNIANLVYPNTNAGSLGACEADIANAYLHTNGTNTTTTQCTTNNTYAALQPNSNTCTRAGVSLGWLTHRAIELGSSQTGVTCASTPHSETVTYPAGLPAGGDPSRGCGRLLFNFLVTDGESNSCNTSSAGNDTIPTYPACASGYRGNITPVAGSPGADINNHYNAGITNPAGVGNGVLVRTFTLGVSNDLSIYNAQQELRNDAYFGRTDAADPYGQGGLKRVQAYDNLGNMLYQDVAKTLPLLIPADPYLRKTGISTPAAGEYVINDGINSLPAAAADRAQMYFINGVGNPAVNLVSGTGYVCNHNYAFTATNTAQVANAIAAALAAVAAGDYTSEAPVIADNTPSPSGVGSVNYVYTASADFPGFAGHLRAQDLDTPQANGGFLLVWDAGQILAARDPATRKIYTLNGAGALVQITPGFSAAGITPNGVSFLLGYDGTLSPTVANKRSWMLGDMTHSPPVVLAPPSAFLQSTTTGHNAFESTWASRTPLVIAGSSDGMVHAFRASTGVEEWAFVPPDLLPAIELQYRYFSNPVTNAIPVGQMATISQHVYGVASRMNIADVDFNAPGGASSDWHTVMVGGLGIGGQVLFALDVTQDLHPATGSPPAQPFTLLWYKNTTTSFPAGAPLTGSGNTWSTPSISLSADGGWVVSASSGPAPDSKSCPNAPCPPNPFTFTPTGNSGYAVGVFVNHFRAHNGVLLKSYKLGTNNTGALMAGTTFPNHTAYATNNIAFPDAIANFFYQTDTAGRIWETDATSASPASWNPNATPDRYLASAAAELQQPIYDAPTIGLYRDAYSSAPYQNDYLQVMTWASGDFFESQQRINDRSCNVGTHPPCFPATLYSRICDLTQDPTPNCGGTNYHLDSLALYNQTYQVGAGVGSVSIINAGSGYTSVPTVVFSGGGGGGGAAATAVVAGGVVTAINVTAAGSGYHYPPTVTLTGGGGTGATAAATLNYAVGGATAAYSYHARAIGSPLLFVPVILNTSNSAVATWPKAGDVVSIHTIYDPAPTGIVSCVGESSVVINHPFGQVCTGSPPVCVSNASARNTGGVMYNATHDIHDVASGAASSAVIYKGRIIVNVSSNNGSAGAVDAGSAGIVQSTPLPIVGTWHEVF